jgi:sodium/hydrogen exchanger 10/11
MKQIFVRNTILLLSVALNAYYFLGGKQELSDAFSDTFSDAFSDELSDELPAERLLAGTTSNSTSNSSCSCSSGTIGSSSSSGSSSSAGGHHGEHGVSHHALLFLLIAMITGVIIMHFVMKYHAMQETVGFFVVGMVFSLVIECAGITDDIGEFGLAYSMWLGIEPHLLLFTLLPPLLAGDAMTIDTTVAKRVAYQCLWLAGPGVLIQAFAVAGILSVYLEGWSFFLCLTMGSILCATDPVAVVALLKELGASPMLTVQIQGESLLNDGTSIVLFKIAYNVVSGVKYDEAKILDFFLKTAMMAWALGMFIGYIFFYWIKCAGDRLEHMSTMIQILLTVCCAYASFAIAEGVLGISGVLSTVAASLILADNMWPHIVSIETMHNVWHAFESIGNIVIFFLGGAITGRSIYESVELRDILDLFVIYLVLLVIRAAFIFGSRPLLKVLNTDKLSVKSGDAAVMTWGGLRGAVGLALAIEVGHDRAMNADGEPQITTAQSQKVLFFVSGIAFLTTIINATTAPALVRKLGILAQPVAKLRLQKLLFSQLVNWSLQETGNNPTVAKGLEDVVQMIENSITGQEVVKDKGAHADSVLANRTSFYGLENATLVKQLVEAEEIYSSMPEEDKELFKLSPDSLLGKVDELKNLVRDSVLDAELAKVVNETFLSLVINSYKEQIANRDLPPGSVESKSLVASVQVTSSRLRPDLTDFEFVLDQMTSDGSGVFNTWWAEKAENAADEQKSKWVSTFWGGEDQDTTAFHTFMQSAKFQIGMALIILLNTIYVLVDGAVRSPANDSNPVWMVFEVLFTVIFIVEFVMKIKDERCKYFRDGSNIFDFFLVVVGTAGCVVELATMGEGSDLGASEARTLRVVRVFRVLRFLRLFRLLRKDWMDFISAEVMSYMKTIRVFTGFVRAHTAAQALLMKYFLGAQGSSEGKAEVARCILQSQSSVYKAISLTVSAKKRMDGHVLEEIESVTTMLKVAEGLENYVLAAHDQGALSAREAEHMLHPLHHAIQHMMKDMRQLHGGKAGHSSEHLADDSANGNSHTGKLVLDAEALTTVTAGDGKSEEVYTEVDEYMVAA